LGGGNSAMPGQNAVLGVDNDRIDKPERFDAWRELTNLLRRMNPSIPAPRLEGRWQRSDREAALECSQPHCEPGRRKEHDGVMR
jgi:hypothetical protein